MRGYWDISGEEEAHDEPVARVPLTPPPVPGAGADTERETDAIGERFTPPADAAAPDRDRQSRATRTVTPSWPMQTVLPSQASFPPTQRADTPSVPRTHRAPRGGGTDLHARLHDPLRPTAPAIPTVQAAPAPPRGHGQRPAVHPILSPLAASSVLSDNRDPVAAAAPRHIVRGRGVPTIAQARRQRRRSMGCTTMAVAASLLSCLLVALLANSILHQPGFLFVAGTTLGTPTTLPVDSSPRPVMTPTPTPTGGHETPPATATTDPRQRPTATPQPVTDPTPTATATSTTIPPTPTPTSIPPTPTVTPVPGAGSIGVTDQGVLEQPNPTLSGCPNGSGCDFADTSVAGSTTISEVCKPGNAYCSPTWQNQTAIEGWVLVTSLNPNGWACSGNTCLTGNGYHCANVSFSVPGSSTINVWCVIYTTSPSSLPPLTIVGIYSGEYLWHNPNTLYGNAGYYETQQDCKNGLNDLANRVGPAWVSSDFASKTAGQIVVRGPSPPHYNSNSWTCNPAVGSNTSSFTVSVAVSYTNGLAFPPANAQAAAQNRLKAAKPAGWTYTKTTTCSPTDSQATGTYTLTTQCGDTGWAVYLWSTTDKAGLAQAVAGDSQSRAIAACEAYPLVKQVTTDACTASGPMPPDWTKITVAVAVPPAPFTASNLNSPAVPIAVTAGLSAPPDDAAILASASLVLLLDGVWLALRSRRVRVLSLPNLDNPDDDEDSDNLEDGDA